MSAPEDTVKYPQWVILLLILCRAKGRQRPTLGTSVLDLYWHLDPIRYQSYRHNTAGRLRGEELDRITV